MIRIIAAVCEILAVGYLALALSLSFSKRKLDTVVKIDLVLGIALSLFVAILIDMVF